MLVTGRKKLERVFALSLVLAAGAPLGSAADPAPSFWDPQHRIEKPDLHGLQLIRFVTEDDYPPFDFLAPDGSLTGFNVDFAKALCEALSVSCTIQARRWDTIETAIDSGQADAAVASIALRPDTRKAFAFTMPYYRTPARFVALRAEAALDPAPEQLTGRTIGVQAHSAHEAYLRAFFRGSDIRTYETEASLLSALKRHEIEVAFGDGVSLAMWLNGAESENCCVFVGGPFTESRYFGDGVGIAVRKGAQSLRQALDWAIDEVGTDGKYQELYLKWFPIGFY